MPQVTHSTIRCPICQHDSQPKFQTVEYGIHQCRYCRHQFVGADPLAGQPLLTEANAQTIASYPRTVGYSNNLSQAKHLRRQGRYYGQLLTHYMPTGQAFDISAGTGLRLQGLMEAGWQVTGIEANVEMVDYAQQSLQLPVQLGHLDDWSPDRMPNRVGYDLVTLIQVIPYLNSLHKPLQMASRITKRRGYWLIEAHNRNSWHARLFNTHWSAYHQNGVKHWFGISDMIQLGRQFGFRPIAWGRPTYRGRLFAWNRPSAFWLLLQKVVMVGKTHLKNEQEPAQPEQEQ